MARPNSKGNKDYFLTQELKDNPFALFVDGEGKREKYTSEKQVIEPVVIVWTRVEK